MEQLEPAEGRTTVLALAVRWRHRLGRSCHLRRGPARLPPSDSAVLDRDGELLQRVRTDTSVRRGEWIALADISPALRSAMLLSEDKRFYEHSGVDWRAVSAAAWGNLWNTRTRGASTITDAARRPARRRPARARGGGRRPGAEARARRSRAQQLERQWRKDQILEAYLNTVPFRGEIVGIDALSRTLFGKAPHGLDAREAAVAAALVRAPNAKPALVAQRGLRADARRWSPRASRDCAALDMFASAALQRRAFDASEGIAPHLARRALKAKRGALTRPGQLANHRCGRRCSASRSTRCSASCANCAAATSRTARWWCSTTPAARCWPGSARPAR